MTRKGVWIVCIVFVVFALFILMLQNSEAWQHFLWQDPCSYPLPPYLANPPESLRVHSTKKMYYTKNWGNPQQDGPDRCMPDTCFWLHGVLHCRPIE